MADVLSAGRVHAVARNTFREALRNRAFVGLMLFGLAFLGFSVVLSELSVRGQGGRVLQDFGFFAVSLIGAVTAIVMGAILLHKEVERKTIYTILSKPIWRYEFVLGKYLGMLGILAVEVVGLGLFWFLVLYWQGVNPGLEHAKGLLLIFMEVAVVCGIGVMFASATSPVLTGIFTLGAFLVGRVVELIEGMLSAARGPFVDNPLLNLLGEGVTKVFPDLSVFNVSQQVLLEIPVGWDYVASSLVYALAFIGVTLAVGMIAFQRRDFI